MEWKLTEDQLAELKESFKLFDKDGDGEINKDDLRTVMRSLGYYQSEQELEDMLDEVDINNTKTIDFTEFVAFLARKCKEESLSIPNNGIDFDSEREEGMREIFNIFTKDPGSDKISRDELKEAMKKYNVEMTDSELDEIYMEYSLNKKELTFDEFISFMMGEQKKKETANQ